MTWCVILVVVTWSVTPKIVCLNRTCHFFSSDFLDMIILCVVPRLLKRQLFVLGMFVFPCLNNVSSFSMHFVLKVEIPSWKWWKNRMTWKNLVFCDCNQSHPNLDPFTCNQSQKTLGCIGSLQLPVSNSMANEKSVERFYSRAGICRIWM